MNTKPKFNRRVYLLLGLGLALLTLLSTSAALAQPPRPVRITPLPHLTPLLRPTPAPRATPFTPTIPCIHLTTDGTPGSSFIGGRIQQRCFAFPGNAGDVVTIRLTAAGAMPALEVRGPDGQIAAKSNSGEIAELKLALDGPYSVLVSGQGQARSMRIELAVTAAANPTSSSALGAAAPALCSGSLAPGVEINGIVPFPGENCLYTFHGQEGQGLGVRMDSLASDLTPSLVLLDPSGAVLDNSHTLGDQAAYVSSLRLPATGIYSVAAGSQDNGSAGAFRLMLMPVQEATCGDTVTLGQKVELTLPPEADCELWVQVPEERLLAGSVAALDGAPAPAWQLLSPRAAVVISDEDTAGFAAGAGLYTLRLSSAASQPARVLLEVATPTMMTTYSLTTCGANLVYGQSPSLGGKPFPLGLLGNECLFNFNGVAGHLLWVAVSRASSDTDFDPVIELMAPAYRPTDAPEATAYSSTVPGMTLLRDHPLAHSGRYTVRITDYGNDDSGAFYIMVWKR